jgi:itaconate CoA-transferase
VLEPIITSAFAVLDRPQMLALLQEADVASGAVNDVAALSGHPQLDRTTIQCPSGEISLPAPPIRRSGGNISLGASPALGAHTAAIRREFAACGLTEGRQ